MKQPYKLKDGSIVPGCTTICNMLDKPQLIDWAWKLGKQGKDWRTERDSAGDIGTLAHKMITDYWKVIYEHKNIADDYHATNYEQGTLAFACYQKFLKWQEAQDQVHPVMVEYPLVSEKLKFGGTPDFVGHINGKATILDVKTSNGIYDSHWLQLAGYWLLLRENGYPVDTVQILWLPKDNRFDDPIRTDLRREKRIFKYLLSIYRERKANEPPF